MSQLEIEDQIVAAVRRIMHAVDVHSRRLTGAFGLTGPQLATLREAARLQPIAAGVLARAVSLSQPTVTGILNRLEKQGLVARARGAVDRRQVSVTVTEAGEGLLARSPSLLQDRFREELSKLEHWERLMILSALERMASMMDAGVLPELPEVAAEGSAPDAELASDAGGGEGPPGSHRPAS